MSGEYFRGSNDFQDFYRGARHGGAQGFSDFDERGSNDRDRILHR